MKFGRALVFIEKMLSTNLRGIGSVKRKPRPKPCLMKNVNEKRGRSGAYIGLITKYKERTSDVIEITARA